MQSMRLHCGKHRTSLIASVSNPASGTVDRVSTVSHVSCLPSSIISTCPHTACILIDAAALSELIDLMVISVDWGM